MIDYISGWRRFGINRSELVLEVGSGDHPLIRSDILCDRYPFSSFERFRNAPLVTDRPVVAGDAIHLPFRDQSIDFIYCNDLAEHLDQPELFFEECMRVGRRGAIITPSLFAERVFGWPYHSVVFENRDGVLLIHRKTSYNWGLCGRTFHQLWLDDRDFRRVVSRNSDIFRMIYRWNGRIRYEYASPQAPPELWWQRVDSDDRTITNRPSWVNQLKRQARSILSGVLRRLALMRPRIDLKDLVGCPLCHRPLANGSNRDLECASCTLSFPCVDGIPQLLRESGRALPHQGTWVWGSNCSRYSPI